jgi:hypothetical protein
VSKLTETSSIFFSFVGISQYLILATSQKFHSLSKASALIFKLSISSLIFFNSSIKSFSFFHAELIELTCSFLLAISFSILFIFSSKFVASFS